MIGHHGIRRIPERWPHGPPAPEEREDRVNETFMIDPSIPNVQSFIVWEQECP